MADLDEIVDLLASYGVHEGFPHQRRALGLLLWENSVREADIIDLYEHVSRTTTETQRPAVLASILSDPKALVERLEDVRRCASLRKQPAYPGAAQWVKPSMPEEQFIRSQNRRMAYALVVADRKPLEEVAKQMSLSPGEVRTLVEEERADRVGPKVKKPEPEKSQWESMTWEQRRAYVRKKI
jgi:hypothetical protein